MPCPGGFCSWWCTVGVGVRAESVSKALAMGSVMIERNVAIIGIFVILLFVFILTNTLRICIFEFPVYLLVYMHIGI